jgi:hypothetical protein
VVIPLRESCSTKPLIFDDLPLECSTPRTKRSVDPITGEITRTMCYRFEASIQKHVPVRCTRNSCYDCAIWNARAIARAIWLSQPDYVLTLTDVGKTYEVIAKRIRKFIEKLRTTYPTFECAWMVEHNPRETGNHAILYIHVADKRISRRVIERAWPRIINLQRPRRRAEPPYFGYQMKSLADPDEAKIYLALNGTPKRKYLVHATNGFWRNGRGGKKLTRAKAQTLAWQRSLRAR